MRTIRWLLVGALAPLTGMALGDGGCGGSATSGPEDSATAPPEDASPEDGPSDVVVARDVAVDAHPSDASDAHDFSDASDAPDAGETSDLCFVDANVDDGSIVPPPRPCDGGTDTMMPK